MTANIDGLPPRMAERFAALRAGQRVMVDYLPGTPGVITEVLHPAGHYLVRLDSDEAGWPPITCLPREVRPIHLVFTWESFDAGGDETERTGPIGPLEVLENLEVCKGEGLSEDGARSVFPVLSAPGVVTVSMPGGWSFRLTSEEGKPNG